MGKIVNFTLDPNFCQPNSRISQFFSKTLLMRWNCVDLFTEFIYNEKPNVTPQEVVDIYNQSLIDITTIKNINCDVIHHVRKIHEQNQAKWLKTIGDSLLDIRRLRAKKRVNITDKTRGDFQIAKTNDRMNQKSDVYADWYSEVDKESSSKNRHQNDELDSSSATQSAFHGAVCEFPKKEKKRPAEEASPVITPSNLCDQTSPSRDLFDIYGESEADYSEIVEWEYDNAIPKWLEKGVLYYKELISEENEDKRIKDSSKSIWWRIIDGSDLDVTREYLPEEDFLELQEVLANALELGTTINDWTILKPQAEKCLRDLSKLNNDQIKIIGEKVRPEGIRGVLEELKKFLKTTSSQEFDLNLFGDSNNQTIDDAETVEIDYLDEDVAYIFDLIRYTCEMIKKKIPKRKNTERDIDVSIKNVIFSCLDNIMDRHFGEAVSRASRARRNKACEGDEGFHLDWIFCSHELGAKESWGCEFSLCERAGSVIDNTKKIFSNTLKVKKTLRDMHMSLMKSIASVSNKSVSKEVQQSFSKLLMPGLLSSHFYLQAVLIVYVGAGFYVSTDLAELEIPTDYNELDKILKVARILLQIKKLLKKTMLVYKIVKERAEKEKFLKDKKLMNEHEEYPSPQKKQKQEKNKKETNRRS